MIQSKKHPINPYREAHEWGIKCIKIINNNITGELMSGAFEH
jgi:hypothetical protein